MTRAATSSAVVDRPRRAMVACAPRPFFRRAFASRAHTAAPSANRTYTCTRAFVLRARRSLENLGEFPLERFGAAQRGPRGVRVPRPVQSHSLHLRRAHFFLELGRAFPRERRLVHVAKLSVGAESVVLVPGADRPPRRRRVPTPTTRRRPPPRRRTPGGSRASSDRPRAWTPRPSAPRRRARRGRGHRFEPRATKTKRSSRSRARRRDVRRAASALASRSAARADSTSPARFRVTASSFAALMASSKASGVSRSRRRLALRASAAASAAARPRRRRPRRAPWTF